MNIGHLLDISITLQSQSGSGSSGDPDPTWGSQRTVKARKDTVTRRVVTPQGEAYVQADVLISDQTLVEGDRYWEPGADTSNVMLAKRLGQVSKRSAFSGYTLWVALL